MQTVEERDMLLTPKAIASGVDGTIAYTGALIVACYLATYEELGLPAPEGELISRTIGLPLETDFRQLSSMDEAAGRDAANL